MTGSPPPGHLPDEKLAGYIDGTLPEPDRRAIEAHLADCPACRAELLASTRAVESAPSPARRSRPAVVALAAAAAVLLIAVARRDSTVGSDDGSATRAHVPPGAGNAITVVAPRNGDTVSARPIGFIWRRSADVLEYTITVQDADGRALWSTSTADTIVSLPDSAAVAPGTVLHWYVDGLRADGRDVGTGRQQLVIR